MVGTLPMATIPLSSQPKSTVYRGAFYFYDLGPVPWIVFGLDFKRPIVLGVRS